MLFFFTYDHIFKREIFTLDMETRYIQNLQTFLDLTKKDQVDNMFLSLSNIFHASVSTSSDQILEVHYVSQDMKEMYSETQLVFKCGVYFVV